MSGRLFLNSVECEGGRVMLGFSVGLPVVLGEAERRRELPGGLSEYVLTATSGSDEVQVRFIADASGAVEMVVASAGEIPDDWHENPEFPEE